MTNFMDLVIPPPLPPLNDRKEDRQTESGHVTHRYNLTSEFIFLVVTNGDSPVKSIVRDQGKAPCMISNTDDLIKDIRNL